jgi:hypothetical protein
MPRLGSAGAPSPPRRLRNQQSPFLERIFGNHNSRPINLRNVLLFLVAFFAMRNLMRRDYRREEIQYLRNSGMSDEQVHRFVPRTAEEQRKYVQDKKTDVEKMKKDIAYLLNEVAELNARSMTTEQQMQQHQHVDNAQSNISSQQEEEQQQQHEDEQSFSGGAGGREVALKTMDKIHQEKRKQQEDELMKANPNFHASKRLRDMSEEEIQKALKK